MTACALFDATDPDRVLDLLHAQREPELDALEASLGDALAGSDRAMAMYVSAYASLSRWMADEFTTLQRMERDEPLVEGDAAFLLGDLLKGSSVEAPFTAWTRRYRPGDAAALHLTNRMRDMVGAPQLEPPAGTGLELGAVQSGKTRQFFTAVRYWLDRTDTPPLERLMRSFELSKSDLASLFGVRRQAIDGWLIGGVPAARQEKLSALSALADLLERKLKHDRMPGVARRSADAYGGLTMLEMIAADRHDELLASVRQAFDWSRAE